MDVTRKNGVKKMNHARKGILATVIAYLIWGVVPLYWKQMTTISSDEIITSRIIWAFILTALLVIILGQGKLLIQDVHTLWQNKKSFWLLVAASYLVSGNWYIFIWAVNHNHIVQTSLGYYINPLISVLLGVLFLKERLSKAQLLACIVAAAGVFSLVLIDGHFPYVALGLSITFGVYGLLKKKIQINPMRGLVIETFFTLPVAVIYYVFLIANKKSVLIDFDFVTLLFLIGTGAVTAIPLILFAYGAQKIPMYLVGFFQYIAPTMTLLLGVLVYHEKFGGIELIVFGFIWLAILIFSYATIKETRKSSVK